MRMATRGSRSSRDEREAARQRCARTDALGLPWCAILVSVTRPRVYVETTIPSFYYDVRPTPDIVVRREWTRRWWGIAAGKYELVTSSAVLEELAGGNPDQVANRLALVRDLVLLPIEPAISEIAVEVQ